MEIKKVVVAGGGILGSQIAFQTAYCGFNVTILIRPEDSKEDLEKKLSVLKETYIECINDMDKNGESSTNWARGIAGTNPFNKKESLDKVNSTLERITIDTDQAASCKDCDLFIESITEKFEFKVSLYKSISPLLKEDTIIVTNSSTLLPSKLAKHTGRPTKYLAMHFANSIWKNNISEIMKQPETSEESFNEIINFANQINMVALPVKQEKSGYLLNSLLVPFLLCAMDLLANDISDPETIDKAWTLGTGAPKGPFQILDTVGLETAKNILEQYQKVPNLFDPLLKKMMLPYNFDGALKIINEYIEKGKKGKTTGEGFYKYN